MVFAHKSDLPTVQRLSTNGAVFFHKRCSVGFQTPHQTNANIYLVLCTRGQKKGVTLQCILK